MAVKLRLKRLGRRHRASYRLAAMDSRSPRDGRLIEDLGIYDPQHKNPELRLRVNLERIEYWLGVGAQPTDTVRDIIKQLKKGTAEPAPAAADGAPENL